MEYRIHTTGSITEEQIWQATRQLFQQSGAVLSLMGHSRDITVSAGVPAIGQVRPISTLVGAGSAYLFSKPAPSSALAPRRVSFSQLSTWGGAQTHYVWTTPNRLLITDGGAFHARWQYATGNWHQSLSSPPISLATAPASLTLPNRRNVAQMSEMEKIAEAIWRGILLLPDQVKKGAIAWFTPANVTIFAGLTVLLLTSGIGEVLGVGLLALGALMGGLDLCINVLKMLFDFYRQATRATSDADLDRAADLFSKIILRGGMDIIDILVGRRALAKLAGRGVRGVGAYLAYLEEQMKLWRGRQGAGTVLIEEAEVIETRVVRSPQSMTNAQKGVYGEHVSDAHMHNQGYTKLNDGGVLTPADGAARGRGIDGVWRNPSPPPEYIITEAKYGSSQLGTTADGRQMSDDWIRGSSRLDRAVGRREAENIRDAMNRGQVEKQLHQIDEQGNITTQVLNEEGMVIR